jgi:hypothetical protein
MQQQLQNLPLLTYGMGPLEVLDFGITWAAWLQPGEIITGTPLIAQQGGDGLLTINPNGEQTAVVNGIVTWWLSTPTPYVAYGVHVTVVTNQGRTSSRFIQINGVQR